MEDVLDVYARPLDPTRPLICFDEGGKDLRDEMRPPIPTRPRTPTRQDYEYVRHGSANLFLACAPWLGWRHVTATSRRTAIDWAEMIRELVDLHFPDADHLVLVIDNLNTHGPASLYKAFPPAEAKRIWDKLEIHYTPIHGSWLNMAECELGALAKQCFLHRRIPDAETLAWAVAAWAAARNAQQVRIAWRFTTADARTKLKDLYPIIDADMPKRP